MGRSTELTILTDKAVGERIFKLRLAMGMSRQQLAGLIDVTHQQLSKWEHGTNRISVGRMVLIANSLKKPISYFFDGLEIPHEAQTTHQRMTIEVARNFALIKNPGHQSVINNMIRELARNT